MHKIIYLILILALSACSTHTVKLGKNVQKQHPPIHMKNHLFGLLIKLMKKHLTIKLIEKIVL